MKNKYRKVVLKTMCAAAMLLSFSFNNMNVSAQTGVTGYQIVVPAKGEDGYYVSQDGTVLPYNAETKGAIDAEVNALLQSKLAEAKNLYGINFNFKKGYNNAQNYHYVNGILQLLSEYPAGSIQVISNATAAKTKRFFM